MRRRDFITRLGGAAATLISARRVFAQPALPVIGFLDSGSAAPNAHLVAAFRQGLSENGYAEGQNVTIEYRWAEGDYDRLASLANDLVNRQVTLIVATGGEPSARAAHQATATIPIVFDTSSNPVELGWVKSLNQPGGNMTGVNQMVEELVAKELGLLHELVPQAKGIAILVNAKYPRTEGVMNNARDAAHSLGTSLQFVTADTDQDLEAVFAALPQQPVGALFVAPGPFFYNRRSRIIALAARNAIPALYVRREFAADGGLMSYGTSLVDTYRQVGIYAGRVLKGEKPADLPIVQPTKFELVINLKTAKALKLAVPQALLASADDVIE